MKGTYLLAIYLILSFIPKISLAKTNNNLSEDPIKLSQDFLYAARTGDSTELYVSGLKNLNEDNLITYLDTDTKKVAFWLNIYNGFTQLILSKDPEQYQTRGAFFSSNQINIAGDVMSLDFIEHGILRRSKVKWAAGYIGKLFPSKLEKDLRVDKLDNRIHFALNCGAKSCPPIAFYDPEQLDSQLDIAVKTYLKGECEFDSVSNTVKVPALMGWFRGDFKGKSGIRKILVLNEVIPEGSKPKIMFKTYDWTLYLENYKS